MLPNPSLAAHGRNHHRIGNGQIAELANDWDGYAGEIPKSSALAAEVLKDYGYATAAFGKWHNTPALETSAAGPFHNWPTGNGFEYFYGFLAGEASQYEPNLVRNTTIVPPPKTPEEGYHLSEDLADDAIAWLHRHQAFEPDKPFYMYWASGCLHGPHHVMKDWADKYQGKFDDGWDAYRERVFVRAKEQGWIPEQAQLTPRDPRMPAWDDIPEAERPFHQRSMEVAAGFAEHVDVQVGRLLDELDHMGLSENTLVFYIWGDNGSSGEGQNGTISELLAQNGIPTTVDMHIQVLNEMGGLDLLGTPKVDNMYHAGWAWAGSTPYKGLKLLASHLGGTRNPMAVKWPAKITPDGTPRSQFHHCNDLVPTIYEVVGIAPPRVVNGIPQDPIDGISFAYSFNHPAAEGRLRTQYFEIMGSRAIYHDGWMASAFGPRTPWMPGLPPGITEWTPDQDTWELYNLDEDWTQANDVAASEPDKLAQMREMFSIEAAKNSVFPVGGALWIPIMHPELRISTPYREWNFTGDITRMPEFCAPALGNRENRVTITADLPESANGVLYALGGTGGGLTAYFDDGFLCYEYNLFILQRTKIRSAEPVPAGERHHRDRNRLRRGSPRRPAQCHAEGQWRKRWLGDGANKCSADLQCKRLPRYRDLPRGSGVTGLLRPSAVPLHRKYRPGKRSVYLVARTPIFKEPLWAIVRASGGFERRAIRLGDGRQGWLPLALRPSSRPTANRFPYWITASAPSPYGTRGPNPSRVRPSPTGLYPRPTGMGEH